MLKACHEYQQGSINITYLQPNSRSYLVSYLEAVLSKIYYFPFRGKQLVTKPFLPIWQGWKGFIIISEHAKHVNTLKIYVSIVTEGLLERQKYLLYHENGSKTVTKTAPMSLNPQLDVPCYAPIRGG